MLIDWPARREVARRPLPMPQGTCVLPGRILVALRGTHEITELSPGGERRWSHPQLANPHTIQAIGRDRFLVTSSATDTLFEFDAAGRVCWRWSAYEHGFQTLTSGAAYHFDHQRDHRRYVSVAADHPVHINAALDLQDGTILATFFHHGSLVRIDRRDGRCTVVCDGLRHPHAIRRRDGGFVLSDSQASRALLLSPDLAPAGVIEGDFDWIQDTLIVNRGAHQQAFVLSNIEIANPEPGRSNRIVEVDLRTGAAIADMNFGPDQHLFSIEPLSPTDAEMWAEHWNNDAHHST